MEKYKLQESDYIQISSLIKISNNIVKLYRKLFELDVSDRKNDEEFTDTLKYLNWAIQVENHEYENCKFTQGKLNAYMNHLVNERVHDSFEDDVMSLFSSNININRILCQLSDRLVILDSAKNDKEENDDLYDIESIINASSVILVSELPKENYFIHNNYDDLNNDMSDSSEYQTTKNFSLSNGDYFKIVNIVEKDIANVWLFLLFSLANNQKYKTIRASLLEEIYTLAYVYMNMANTLLTYFRTNHFMIIDDDIVINKLGITCDDYYLYRNEHLTNTLIGAMESLLLISNDDYKNKMIRLKVIYNQ